MLVVTKDVVAIQNSYLPSLELFYQATGSKAAATFIQAYMTLLYYSKATKKISKPGACWKTNILAACVPSQWITCSRIAWAFSRDVS